MSYCPACGAATTGGAFCSSCGKHLHPHAMAPDRPLGVTLVAVGFFLLAAGSVFAALAFAAVGPFAEAFWFPFSDWVGPWMRALHALMMMLALLVLLFAALSAAVGVGLLQGRAWAWGAALVVSALACLGNLPAVAELEVDGVLGALVWGGVVYYFLRPEVRAYFGQAPR